MLKFKEWLLTVERDEGSISNYLYGAAPEADEFPSACRNPQKLELLKKRLKNTVKLGGVLINIDMDALNAIPIIYPKGRSLPMTRWKHKPD